MKFLVGATTMLAVYLFMAFVMDAPPWGSMVGAWVFWIAVRPKEWQ